MEKLSVYQPGEILVHVRYVETLEVKEGVSCDTYKIEGDDSYDLARISVSPGSSTPLQKVLNGTQTIERYYSGDGVLTVHDQNGHVHEYVFPNATRNNGIEITIGDTIMWHTNNGLIFDEICFPAYQDGRFENISE